VSVLLGNGNGTFRAAVNFAVGYHPGSLVVGDFNGDGTLDVAVANAFDPNGTVTVLLGNGDGTFGTPVSYPAGASPGSLAEGDFAGDGILDLAVANSTAGTLSILRGRGDGTFQAPVSYAVGGDPSSVAVADFNGDGFLDLAVANPNSTTFSVLLGRGDGTFQGAHTFAFGAGLRSLAVGDFNGDGIPDLAVASATVSGTVSVLLGRGDGTFQPRLDYYSSGRLPLSVATADFNGDGFADLAVPNFESNNITVLLNDGVWGPAPRPAGHGHREPAALVAAVPDIGWPSTLGPLPLTISGGDETLLPGVLGSPAAPASLPTWARAASPPLERPDAAFWVDRFFSAMGMANLVSLDAGFLPSGQNAWPVGQSVLQIRKSK
jgi:hypothetical protein